MIALVGVDAIVVAVDVGSKNCVPVVVAAAAAVTEIVVVIVIGNVCYGLIDLTLREYASPCSAFY